jgi:hypothetical protein
MPGSAPKRLALALALSLLAAGWSFPGPARTASAPRPQAVKAPVATTSAGWSLLPKPGKRVTLDAAHYFVYGFTKPPKVGTAILRVEVFTRDGNRDTSFVVKGDADMPSMRGAHTMGDKEFAKSKKGEYLLPIPLVMPGDWEIRLTFEKDGKTALRGIHLFDL